MPRQTQHYLPLLVLVAVLLLMVACQPQATMVPGSGAATLAPEGTLTAYPGPENTPVAATALPENYPAPDATVPGAPSPTLETYPAPDTTAPGAPSPTLENYPAPDANAPGAPSPTLENYPAPDANAPALYPRDIRTGLAEVDPVLAAAQAGDVQALKNLVRYTLTACASEPSAGGPPRCAAGERNGSQVEVFPVQSEQAGYVRRAEIEAALNLQLAGLYAVYEVPANAPTTEYWPAGRYALVFQGSDPRTSVTLLVQDGYLVRIDNLPVSPADVVATAGGILLLAPLQGGQEAYPAP